MMHDAAFESVTGEDREPPERRLFQRYLVALDASLELGGRHHACVICDLSLGGACVEPALVGAEGRRVRLSSPHFDFGPIDGRIVAVTRGGCHVAFDLSPGVSEALTWFLVGPAQRHRE